MCVVFLLNGIMSVLILHPREIQILWSQTVRQSKNKTTAFNPGKASEMLAYLVREHNKTSQTRKTRKIMTKKTKKKEPTGVLNNVMQEDQKGCKKNNIRVEEEQTTAARTKQHEDEKIPA